MPNLTEAAARLRRLAIALSLTLPLALLASRAAADIDLSVVAVLFLMHSIVCRSWRWARQPFAIAALLWWLWLILGSALGTGGLGLALAAIRLPLFSLALGAWVLTDRRARDGVWLGLVLAAAWIALESWQQYFTGHNWLGAPRWPDGALTGPFIKPRAGPELILIFFPALVPVGMALAERPDLRARLAAALLAVFAVATTVLIGQRMPTVLMLLGLALCAALLPRLRPPLAIAALCGGVLLVATPVVSPATYGKLVLHFADQLRHFGASPYGLIYVRAAVIAQAHPWLGLGVDGFRRACADPAYFRGLPWLGIPTQAGNGGLLGCNLHPHNYYLEAADNAGLPGLLLFAALVATALVRLAAAPLSPRRIGLLVGVVVALWPVASTSGFMSLPNAGWVFLLLGLGFAEAAGLPLRPAGLEPATKPL